jgi:pyrimidine operon attenuation protein / uracil phosphoribosyltransferase
MAGKGNQILDEATIRKKLKRMALEILEKNAEEKELILAGIRENGNVVAENIRKCLAELSAVKTQLISITLDKRQPGEIKLSDTPEFNNKVIIIIDDVSNSGKTLLYALKPFLDHQAKSIQTLVLVERRHNSFPVHPDYVGLSIATTLQEHITVEVEKNQVTGAYLG